MTFAYTNLRPAMLRQLCAALLLFASICCYPQSPANIIANFQMDAFNWRGQAGEVIDSSRFRRNGVAYNMTTVTGKICNAGDFSADSTNDYLSLNHQILNGRKDFTVSVWARSTYTGLQALVSAAHRRQSNEALMWFPNTRYFQPYIKGRNRGSISTQGAAGDGKWRHLVWTRQAAQNCLYIDGVLHGCINDFSTAALSVDAGGLIIGQEQDSVGGRFDRRQDWQGQLDELLFFDTALNTTQISSIHANQQAGNNWDGSARVCVPPPPLPVPVAEYRMEEPAWRGQTAEVVDGINGLNGNALGGLKNTDTAPAVSGDPGTCRYGEFDGINDAVKLGNPAALNFSGQITLSAWIRPDKSNSIRNIIAHGYRARPNQAVFLRIVNGNYQMGVWGPATAVASVRVPRGDVGSGRWTHLAGSYDGTTWRLYRNGVMIASRRHSVGAIQVAESWAIGARGTGRSRHFDGGIDEVRFYNTALTQSEIRRVMNITRPCHAALDHYSIDHSGAYATCEPASITITAHDLLHANVAATAQTINLSTNTSIGNNIGNWSLDSGLGTLNNGIDGLASYTFAAAEESVKLFLTHTEAAAVVDINISDGANTELKNDSVEDRPLTFAEAALRFYTDSSTEAISAKISNKPSNVTPENQTLTLRAVRTRSDNTDANACEAALQGSQTVSLGYACENPGTCVGGELLSLAGSSISSNPASPVTNFTNVTLNFNTAGEAPLNVFNYSDAGLIRLYAKTDVPARAPNRAITLAGASNAFTVKPAGLCVETTDVDSDCPTQNASCSPFVAAGDAFNLKVSGRGWESNTDTNLCVANNVTPNYRASGIALKPELLSPSGSKAVNGALTITTANIVANGETAIANQSYSEAGVIKINAASPPYHNEVIPKANSIAIGRFTPAYFKAMTLKLVNRNDLSACITTSTFTYLGEPLKVELSISAYNRSGEITRNYHSGNQANENFALLDHFDKLNIAAISGTNNLTTRINNESTPTFNWNLTPGEALITANFSVSREPAGIIDGSFTDTRIGIAPIDDDGVALEPGILNMDTENPAGFDRFDIGGTDLYYGRLHMQNAFGPQQQTLAMPVTAEYFNGQRFVKNTQDNCTPIETPTLENYEGNLQSGETDVINMFSPFIGGSGEIELAATPTIDDYGNVDVTIATEPWLKFNWNEALMGDEMPTGKATFGIYRGHDRIIYRHEVLQ